MAVLTGEWRKLPLSLSELSLSSVLRCGQSFRWKSSGPDEWSCALSGRILSLHQDQSHLHYRAIFPTAVAAGPRANDDTVELIKDYFNLSINLTSLYEQWSSRDAHFSKKSLQFAGIRMLRQEPWENLVSFICSSNNNIARISQMVDKLCVTFGPELGTVDGTTYHDFPPPSALIDSNVEQKLRDLGFGYRAKYISQTARIVVDERPTGWLDGLRKVEYREAHRSLLELSGVGPKVADCVCLMSLDKTEAVPVDTHVWQIAQRDYKFGKGRHKSLTKATYDAIGDHFRELWGNEAGWAHSVLFTADLKAFSEKEVKVEEVVGGTVTTLKTVKKVVRRVKREEPEDRGTVEPERDLQMDEGKEDAVKQETLLEEEVAEGVKKKLKIEDESKALELQGVTMSLAERVKRRRRR